MDRFVENNNNNNNNRWKINSQKQRYPFFFFIELKEKNRALHREKNFLIKSDDDQRDELTLQNQINLHVRACMKSNFFDRAYDKSLVFMVSCPAFPRHREAKTKYRS